MALLTQEQQRQVEEAVTRAELRTDAEIVTVLAPVPMITAISPCYGPV